MKANIHWLYGIVATVAVVEAVLCEGGLLIGALAVDATTLACAVYLTALIWAFVAMVAKGRLVATEGRKEIGARESGSEGCPGMEARSAA